MGWKVFEDVWVGRCLRMCWRVFECVLEGV